jgi:hypothetical protein
MTSCLRGVKRLRMRAKVTLGVGGTAARNSSERDLRMEEEWRADVKESRDEYRGLRRWWRRGVLLSCKEAKSRFVLKEARKWKEW